MQAISGPKSCVKFHFSQVAKRNEKIQKTQVMPIPLTLFLLLSFILLFLTSFSMGDGLDNIDWWRQIYYQSICESIIILFATLLNSIQHSPLFKGPSIIDLKKQKEKNLESWSQLANVKFIPATATSQKRRLSTQLLRMRNI